MYNKWRMSFTTGGLYLHESVDVAKLHMKGEPWADTISRAVDRRALMLPKAASNHRTLREITLRLSTFTDDELVFFVQDASEADRKALLWLAVCRTYYFIKVFYLELVRERYATGRTDVPLDCFSIFFCEKSQINDDLLALKPSTQNKLRQVMFRIMREADIISDKNQIQVAILSNRLKKLIESVGAGELMLFPGL